MTLAFLFIPSAFAEARTIQDGRLVLIVPELFTTQDEKDVVRAMEEGMKAVEDFLGKGKEKVTVRVYARTGDFTIANRVPWWVGGMLVGDEIQIQPVGVLKRKRILASTLTHEYAHLVMREITGERGPKWLQEGTAVYLARESPGEPKRKLSWEALERRVGQPFKNRDLAFEAYREARSIIGYLVTTYGREKYINLLENMRVGDDLDTAMRKAFGKGSKEIQANFLQNS